MTTKTSSPQTTQDDAQIQIAQSNAAQTAASYRDPALFATQLSEDTVRFERLLPGPIDRVWSYLTDSQKRGKWLASGDMPPRVGAEVTLTFTHSGLSPIKAPTPEKFKKYEPSVSGKHRVLRYEPTRVLSITWGEGNDASEVDFELTPEGDKVRLVVTHRRLGSRADMVNVSGGWHTHLAVLNEILNGRVPPSFWTLYGDLESRYEKHYADGKAAG
jgi:uncharacterized protein YndB with AHSA1/START domain